MPSSRRELVKGLLGVPLGAAAMAAISSEAAGSPEAGTAITLPDKESFSFTDTFLNGAYAHPMCAQAYQGAEAFLNARVHDPAIAGPRSNPRNAAVKAFAGLINADPGEIAVVPSTMGGENMICLALGLDRKTPVLTDGYHYDASLAMYGELNARNGVPVSVVAPRDFRIDLNDMDAQIKKGTRLVALSLVASPNGYEHDLKAVCDLAHAKGALVYADIVQAAGAIPIDVKQSGVDFACCGTYKWLMADFGVAFLYVRPDRLAQLKQVQIGWRSIKDDVRHVLPFDPPGRAMGDWKVGTDTASRFEVGTPNWLALGAAASSIAYIQSIGVENIVRYRQPLIDRLQSELPRRGFTAITPKSRGPIVAYAYQGLAAKFGPAIEKAKIKVTLSENIMRVSPSVYNDMDDIEHLLDVLKS